MYMWGCSVTHKNHPSETSCIPKCCMFGPLCHDDRIVNTQKKWHPRTKLQHFYAELCGPKYPKKCSEKKKKQNTKTHINSDSSKNYVSTFERPSKKNAMTIAQTIQHITTRIRPKISRLGNIVYSA